MKALRTGARLVSVVLFATMFLAVLAQVIFRYVLNMPVGWFVEVALNSFLVGAFWTIAWHVPIADHVRFDVVYARVPEAVQHVLRAVSGLVVAALLLTALPAALKYVAVMNRINTGVLKMPLSWVFGIFVVFLVVMSARFVFDALVALRRIVSRRSPEA